MSWSRPTTLRELLTVRFADRVELEGYLTLLREKGFDNLVALKARVQEVSDLRDLGISKVGLAKVILAALQEVQLSTLVMPPPPSMSVRQLLFFLLECHSLMDDHLLQYSVAFQQGLGCNCAEDLMVLKESDLDGIGLLEGHRLAMWTFLEHKREHNNGGDAMEVEEIEKEDGNRQDLHGEHMAVHKIEAIEPKQIVPDDLSP